MAGKLNRDVIAQAGLRLLDATGIEGITMRALAAELGVQAPTLYWHVKSKQDIFRAMAVAMSRDASALVTAAAVRPGRNASSVGHTRCDEACSVTATAQGSSRGHLRRSRPPST
jgi:AcrR family transcriptional regulator